MNEQENKEIEIGMEINYTPVATIICVKCEK